MSHADAYAHSLLKQGQLLPHCLSCTSIEGSMHQQLTIFQLGAGAVHVR